MKDEQTGIRNLHFSLRHRQYGAPLYIYDMDFIEYNSKCEAVFAYEEKHGFIKEIDVNSFQLKCLGNTAKKLGIPFGVLVVYAMDDQLRLVSAENTHPATHFQFYFIPITFRAPPRCFTEKQFIKLLYSVRGLPMPEVLEKLPNPCTIWHDVKLPTIIR